MYPNYQQPQQQIVPIFNPASVNVGMNNIPQIPQLQLKWQDTQQFVQMIAVCLANIAARQALNNPARTLVFNRIFENNLLNTYFFGTIVAVADFIGFGILRQQINQGNIQAAIEQNCENVLAAFTAMCIVNEPMLANTATHETINNAKNSLMMFQRQVDEVKYFNQQSQQQQWGQPQPQHQNYGYGQNNFGMNIGGDGFNNRSFGGTPTPNQNQPFNQFPMTGQTDRSFPTANNNQAFTGQWSSSPMANTPAFIKMPPEEVDVAVNAPDQVELVWKPSILQAHRYAFDPLRQGVRLIQRNLDGELIVVEELYDLTQEEIEMEWNKHKLQESPALAAVREHIEVDLYRNPTIEEVRDAKIEPTHSHQVIENIQGLTGAELSDDFLIKVGINKPAYEDRDENGQLLWKEASFVSDAMLGVKIHHAQMKDSKTMMRRERFIIPKVFVCKHEVRRVIAGAFKEKNFLVTAMKLKEFINEPNTIIEQKETIAELDRYLAALINIFICDYLSISNIWIDSFIGDVPVLFDGYIEKECGPLVFQKFKENQHRIYNSYLKICETDELINSVISQYGSIDPEQYDEENGDICFLVLEQNYTVTSVRLTSDEIKLDSSVSLTSKIIDGLYPAMVEYCRNLFETPETINEDWAGHLLITSNGKTYNFMESPIIRKTYLAKEFNLIHLMP